MNKAVSVAGTIAVLAALGAGIWWFSTRGEMFPRIGEQVEVDLSLQGVRLSMGKEGRQSWSLQAEKARFDEETGLLHLSLPRVIYQGEPGDAPVSVQAPEGEVSQERNTARMWPEVQAEYQGYTVTADRLEYVGKQDRITFTGDVLMSGKGSAIRAPEAAIDLKENVMTARGGVVALLAGSGEGDLPEPDATAPEKGEEKR